MTENTDARRHLPKLFAGFALLSAFYILSVLLKTGYISDDAYNSQISGTLIQNQMSLFDRTWNEIFGWMRGAGRFYPLSFGYTYPFFYYVKSLLAYKLVAVSVVIASVAFFALFLNVMSGSWVPGVLATLIAPALFQFRAWHDPLLGFAFLLPLVMLDMSVAFWAFAKSLTSPKRRWIWIAAIAYTCALMTYEISYLLCVCFAAIAWEQKRSVREALRASALFLGMGAFMVLLAFALKSKLNPYFNNAYLGVSIRWYFPHVYKTFFIQTYATLPLSWFLRAHDRLTGFLSPIELTFFLPFAGALTYLLRQFRTRLSARFFFGFGLALLAIPAVPLAVSSGYQDQLIGLGWGIGYLPVYLQYFGLLVVLLGLYQSGARALDARPRAAWGLAGVVALLITTIAVLHVGENRVVALGANRGFTFPRQVLHDSFKRGFLDSVPEGAIILRNARYPADHTWAYTTYTGRIWLLADPSELIEALGKLRKQASPKSLGALRMKDATEGVVPVHPVPAVGEWAEWLPTSAQRTEQVVDLSKWQVYALTFSFDYDRGKTGVVYLSRVDQLRYDPQRPESYSLRARDLRYFDYATKGTEKLTVPTEGLEFRSLIELSAKAPIAPAAFDPKGYPVKVPR